MVDAGKDYAVDVAVPKVTTDMITAAIKVILGRSINSDDAQVIFEALGITEDDLKAAAASR